jgi:hypothetical protein
VPSAPSDPIVPFVDRGFETAPFAAALCGELDRHDAVDEVLRPLVAGLVTGLDPGRRSGRGRRPLSERTTLTAGRRRTVAGV